MLCRRLTEYSQPPHYPLLLFRHPVRSSSTGSASHDSIRVFIAILFGSYSAAEAIDSTYITMGKRCQLKRYVFNGLSSIVTGTLSTTSDRERLTVDKSLIILGSGYTARFLLPLASRLYAHVFATSRDPDKHLAHIAPDRRVRFDLSNQDTWKNIPTGTNLLWCFPAMPLDLVQKFASTLDPLSRRLVVLGSTSAYEITASREYPPPWVDETAPIDLTKPRVQAEEFLRTNCGAIVLRVVGIYGPGRNPIDWIRTGRVGPSRKYVNLIHVEDLAKICLAVLEHGKPGEICNVSDGTPRTWEDICQFAQQHWDIRSPTLTTNDQPGKRISNAKLTKEFDHTILYPDLYRELHALEQ